MAARVGSRYARDVVESGASGLMPHRCRSVFTPTRPQGPAMNVPFQPGVAAVLVAAALILAPPAAAAELPEWTARIRADHPRLFFNAETFPEVRARALGEEREWFEGIRRRVDTLDRQTAGEALAPRDLGVQSAWAAFVFLVTEEPKYRDLARRWLAASLDYYELCFEERRTVNWFSTSRVHATLAWDWLHNHLAEEERAELFSRLVQAVDNVLTVRPTIYRENMSGYNTGFYGVRNCQWFIGCTGFGTGIEQERVEEWLVWGYEENQRLLEHRRRACGNDGGGASPTLGYVFGAYPWAEQNFLYTWLSASGEEIAGDWPHAALLANYVIWNWIEADPVPLEFGYGDAQHTTNRLSIGQLYTHMANIRHLYGSAMPEAAALARHVQERLPERNQGYTTTWFIYPFLLTRLDETAEPLEPEDLPRARHFDTMGQVFIRSGTTADDTYCLFTCGGILRQHRHYDALNFVIYHRGFLALDSGTRHREFENGEHLANYYAQTVAHNCVLVHQPGEPPARYWGGTVEANHGGQHRQLGSEVVAFETNDDFVYVAGDGTPTYLHGGGPGGELPEKVEMVTRQLVFLPPNHFVIFDRVVATDPAYRKEWLLHTAHEPAIEGHTVRADHGEGRLFCRTLLPADATLEAVGGPGREFWAAGRNWEIVADDLSEEQLAMMGQWRIEVGPGALREEDVFLHVIEVGDQERTAMAPVEQIEGPGRAGARLTVGETTWEVTFATEGPLGGHIRRHGGSAPPLDRPLTYQVQPQSGIWGE